jgi:hypothetical protein
MKSRLAVSVLFILIAATFTPDVAAVFERLRTWTATVWGHYAIQRRYLVTFRDWARMSAMRDGGKQGVMMIRDHGLPLSRNSATENQPGVVRTIPPDGKTITSDSLDSTKLPRMHNRHQRRFFKLVGSTYHGENLEFITAAAKQIHEMLDLIASGDIVLGPRLRCNPPAAALLGQSESPTASQEGYREHKMDP